MQARDGQPGAAAHADGRPQQAGASTGGSQAIKLLAGLGLAWLKSSRHPGQPAPRPAPTGKDTPPTGATGREADSPTQIPAQGWWQVLKRVASETSEDHMTLIAAGCAFYALLALFPAITALVSIYGLIADPATIEQQLGSIRDVIPQEAFTIIQGQLHAVAAAGKTALGWGALVAILFALYSASSGISTLFTALNIAYEEEEKRGTVRLYATALAFTLAAVVSVAVCLIVIVGVPAVLSILPLGPLADWAVRIISWAVLGCLVITGIAMLYRFGPSRAPAQWRWATPGSITATILWLIASVAFSFYAARFGSYNETYGALGGVIILLMWLWISALSILIGAELNSELELQTAQDTTTGEPKPMGDRSAYAADHTADERKADPTRGESVSAGA